MITDHYLETYNDILSNLNKLGVPGNGLSWNRINEYAKDYLKYTPLDIELDSLFIKLTNDQEKAWNKILNWLKSSDNYFVLRGYAGSGKSFLLKKLKELDITVYYTAPTNKATKVLSRFTQRECHTIYSLLGIRMSQDDDKLVLTYSDDPPYIPKNSVIVIDESSMISEGLLSFIKKTVKRTKCKVLFVGDPAQLPPVGETRTKAWSVTNLKENHAFLKKVVRYDNQLLSLATEIRENIKTKNYYSPIKDDNQKDEGVFLLPKSKFMNLLEMYNKPEDFIDRKVIAWKNVTVNHYNNSIRENLGFNWPFEKNDILLIAEPVEQNGQIVSTIDDEYIVQSVDKSSIKVYKNKEEQPYIKVWSLIVQDDSGTQLTLSIPIDKGQLHEVLTYRANLAKNAENSNDRRSLWREFWAIKRTFHSVRYGYALTAHRAQGSTYTSCFIDQRDIMSNTNKKEALRCLYVAATRPTTSLFTF